MNEGVLLFALNNDEIDYTKLSIFCAKQVKKYLNKPVALATDNVNYFNSLNDKDLYYIDHVIDINQHDIKSIDQTRIYSDGSLTTKVLPWKNSIRVFSYQLTPFDKTLVIDSDFLMFNSDYNCCFNQRNDFLIHKKSVDLSFYRKFNTLKRVSDKTIDFFWATVFYFEKNNKNQLFFDLLSHILDNWDYYRFLYNIESKTFRNDYAFSIAIHILNGFNQGDLFPSFNQPLYYTLDKDLAYKINESGISLLIEKENRSGEYTFLNVKEMNVHVMNKFSLMRLINE